MIPSLLPTSLGFLSKNLENKIGCVQQVIKHSFMVFRKVSDNLEWHPGDEETIRLGYFARVIILGEASNFNQSVDVC